jgi:hypothetical protein
MGEWSDYFEDFPEENPGNYVNGVFDPLKMQRKGMQGVLESKVEQDLRIRANIQRRADSDKKA